MISPLSYFIRFFKDGTILLKKYLNNCAGEKPDWRPIIIITYDKYIFSAKNEHKKYELLIIKAFCNLKKKEKIL